MKSMDYWKKRAENISNHEFEKADSYKLQLEEEYKKALKNICEDIDAFHNKFANDNKISISEAKKMLARDELKDFKISLDEFIKKAKNNENLKWENELNNLSSKVRITRLQSLQAQIRNQIESLYTKQQDNTTNLLSEICEDTYYRNIYEVHRGLGIGVNFAKLDTNTVNKIISEPWHGNNYSNRIWNNKELLIKELQSNLTQAFIRGDSIDKTSKIIANRMNVGIGRARTLVNTESANIISKATFDSYSGSGVVKEYEILATLDLHTSKICRSMDGKVFKVFEKEIGVNAPPFHPNCRSTTMAYFDDAIDEERIARDPVTGETNYVPGDIKYEDWYKENVANNSKALAEEKKIQNKSTDKKQYEKYKDVLGKDLDVNNLAEFQELKYNNKEHWDRLAYKYKLKTVYNLDNLKNTEIFSNKNVIKHILEGEVNRRGKAVGFHMENMPTKKGEIIESTRSKVDKNGIYNANVTINGVSKIAKSTFFPINMTPQQVVNVINEAYLTMKPYRGAMMKGNTKCGFDIGIYLDEKGKISTAFPLIV
ncbi:minor capsid protein [Clostridium peptidivorans]|uniref:minor capsid protein n=1 Tax=Clostridium peptidivorans TaxID=100174 RepID=UPI0015CE1412|nr:minor capsid protein [Clostridium peptidivorans]